MVRLGQGSQALRLRHLPFCPSPLDCGDRLAPMSRFLGQLGLPGSQMPSDDTAGWSEGRRPLLTCSGSWLTVPVSARSQGLMLGA